MGSSQSNKQKSLIIFYSTLFILVFQLLLIRISPQLYSILNPLPFLIIGLAVKYSDFFKSCALVLLIFVFINFFSEDFSSKQLIIFHFITSFVTMFFFGSFHLSKKINLDSSNFLSGIIISFLFILAFFYILFFNNVEYEKLSAFVQKSIDQVISNYGLQKNNELDKIIKIVMIILPSINSLIFFITFSLNFIFSKFILKKFMIKPVENINFINFTTPLWFSLIYLMMLLIVLTQKQNSQMFVLGINALICMSFSFLLEGYNAFNNHFKKIKLNNFIKFLIIFLLFVFLGYVLFLILLFLGMFENISKKAKKRR